MCKPIPCKKIVKAKPAPTWKNKQACKEKTWNGNKSVLTDEAFFSTIVQVSSKSSYEHNYRY